MSSRTIWLVVLPSARASFERRLFRSSSDITYDPRYNVAYIRLRKKTAGVKTVQVSEEINVDLAPDGKVYGIELLNAGEQLIKGKKISFMDESTGKTRELPLT